MFPFLNRRKSSVSSTTSSKNVDSKSHKKAFTVGSFRSAKQEEVKLYNKTAKLLCLEINMKTGNLRMKKRVETSQKKVRMHNTVITKIVRSTKNKARLVIVFDPMKHTSWDLLFEDQQVCHFFCFCCRCLCMEERMTLKKKKKKEGNTYAYVYIYDMI
ncbi:hypothetical protein RFI_29541 [Reticulomyxa filosa]|uniref:Uncharacterized protein n=1 Tax=Reticulomyxa filosa TaxID=46433 RepID=X6M124_RETFI|nr:hypothetical protein RFI_29541 [Reticulomyxa filosa]|eukprot:ETO07848.1 hypothetical protein RFI_29541 [Reticulomyxa filosa]